MEQCIPIARIDLDDAAKAILSLLQTFSLMQRQAKVVERWQVVWLDLEGAAVHGDRQLGVAGGLQVVPRGLFRQCRRGDRGAQMRRAVAESGREPARPLFCPLLPAIVFPGEFSLQRQTGSKRTGLLCRLL